MLLRPEQLRLVAPSGTLPRARVRSVDFYGHDARVWLELPTGTIVSARLEGMELPVEGQDVSIAVVGPALSFPAGAPLGTGPADDSRSMVAGQL